MLLSQAALPSRRMVRIDAASHWFVHTWLICSAQAAHVDQERRSRYTSRASSGCITASESPAYGDRLATREGSACESRSTASQSGAGCPWATSLDIAGRSELFVATCGRRCVRGESCEGCSEEVRSQRCRSWHRCGQVLDRCRQVLARVWSSPGTDVGRSWADVARSGRKHGQVLARTHAPTCTVAHAQTRRGCVGGLAAGVAEIASGGDGAFKFS